MNINRTSNRTPFRTTRSKSSCAKMANSISARDGKQNSFEEVLKQSTSARGTFNSVSSVKRTPTREFVSSVQDTQAKLDKISEAIKNTAYSGMSKAEIYADIEKKYADSFDDFYATLAISACREQEMIHDQFVDNVHNYVGYLKGTVREARGYSDMTFDEIETSIKEKYVGKTDFISQLNLFGELFSSGVLSNKYGRTEACNMASKLSISVECGGDGVISKNEWLSRIEQTWASSPFSLLLNNPYLAKDKEKYQAIVDDILFGIMDKVK